MNSKHFIGIHGYMLVYSVASLQSFEMVQVIREKLLNHLVSLASPALHPHIPLHPDQTPFQTGHDLISNYRLTNYHHSFTGRRVGPCCHRGQQERPPPRAAPGQH